MTDLWHIKAGLYQRARSFYPFKTILQKEVDNCRFLISENGASWKRVLDIGTGYGLISDVLPGKSDVFGLDRTPNMVKEARAITGFRVLVGDAADLPVRSASFSHSSAIGLAEYISDKRQLLTEISRILESRGLFLVTISPPGFFNFLRNGFGSRIYTQIPADFERLARDAGFELKGKKKSWLQVQYLLRKK